MALKRGRQNKRKESSLLNGKAAERTSEIMALCIDTMALYYRRRGTGSLPIQTRSCI